MVNLYQVMCRNDLDKFFTFCLRCYYGSRAGISYGTRVNKTVNTFPSQLFYVHPRVALWKNWIRFLLMFNDVMLCYSAVVNVSGLGPVEGRMACMYSINHSVRSER